VRVVWGRRDAINVARAEWGRNDGMGKLQSNIVSYLLEFFDSSYHHRLSPLSEDIVEVD
jgi:hypothetical protein